MRFPPPMLALCLLACSEYALEAPGDEVEPSTEAPATTVPSTPDTPNTPTTPATPPTQTHATPDIDVDVVALQFGALPAECHLEHLVTVTNVGTADLIIDDIHLQDDLQFSLLGGPLTLMPNEETQLVVTFTPDDVGAFSDLLVVRSNDPDESEVQVGLLGEGAAGDFIEEVFLQEGVATPVDILFVVDNSTSMGDENWALANNFQSFMQGFLNLGLDYQIGVVTTDMQTAGYAGLLQGPIIDTSTPNPVWQFEQNTDIPFTTVMEEQGLDAVQAALTAPLATGANAGLVRPGSMLSVIVISDEDDQSLAEPSDLISLLDTYQGDADLSSLSIVGGPTGGIWPCGSFLFGAQPVPRYWEVAQATGGIHLNLCQLNMNSIVQQLAVVAAGLSTEFSLSSTPADPAGIEVFVDGASVPESDVNGWIYDPAGNRIVFSGTGIPMGGSEIRVALPTGSGCP